MKPIAAALVIFVAGSAFAAECDLPCKMDKALQGDGQAALDMAQASLYQSHEIMINWYRIAAENGHPVGQWNYANWLVTDSKSRQDCIRAVYWFKRAHASGHNGAKDAASQLQAALGLNAFEDGCKGAL